jgi:hypothetical protein
MSDHKKGCEGRTYTCTCGYDEAQAAENETLRKALYRLGKAGQAIAETFTAYEELRDLDGTEMLWLMTDYGSVGKNLGQELMAALMQANEAYGEVG